MIFDTYTKALDDMEKVSEDFEKTIELATKVRNKGRVYFIGNGGSAAIASHMAIDWMNKGKFAAMAFNDAPALTCIANDYGYADIFERQLAHHLSPSDLLFAISSSGRSPNVINAARKAAETASVVTLSGFDFYNPLTQIGAVKFHVPSHSYSVVETTHLAILHGLLDRLAA